MGGKCVCERVSGRKIRRGLFFSSAAVATLKIDREIEMKFQFPLRLSRVPPRTRVEVQWFLIKECRVNHQDKRFLRRVLANFGQMSRNKAVSLSRCDARLSIVVFLPGFLKQYANQKASAGFVFIFRCGGVRRQRKKNYFNNLSIFAALVSLASSLPSVSSPWNKEIGTVSFLGWQGRKSSGGLKGRDELFRKLLLDNARRIRRFSRDNYLSGVDA